MIRYIHGSEDSLDLDTYYIFEELPDRKYCNDFCRIVNNENKNIIVINNGTVADCYKGTVDEINNGLIDTYSLHKQDYPLLIMKRVDRDIVLKDIRATRGMLSYFSRTERRKDVKFALRNSFKSRIDLLNELDFGLLNGDLGKTYNKEDIFKVFAFQLGQSIALHSGEELYTKSSISNEYPELKPFLYRKSNLDGRDLNKFKEIFLENISKYDTAESDGIITFKKENRVFDIKHEKEIKVK